LNSTIQYNWTIISSLATGEYYWSGWEVERDLSGPGNKTINNKIVKMTTILIIWVPVFAVLLRLANMNTLLNKTKKFTIDSINEHFQIVFTGLVNVYVYRMNAYIF
jgi:hypothetical protein